MRLPDRFLDHNAIWLPQKLDHISLYKGTGMKHAMVDTGILTLWVISSLSACSGCLADILTEPRHKLHLCMLQRGRAWPSFVMDLQS